MKERKLLKSTICRKCMMIDKGNEFCLVFERFWLREFIIRVDNNFIYLMGHVEQQRFHSLFIIHSSLEMILAIVLICGPKW